MELKDIAQIILIPILTVILSFTLDRIRERSTRSLKKDQETFASLKASFTDGRDLVIFFRDHSVGDPIHHDYVSQIDSLNRKLHQPDFIFIDRKLERHRRQLEDKVSEFMEILGTNIFPQVNSDFYELNFRQGARRGEPEASREFNTIKSRLDQIGTDIYKIYSEITVLAQKRL